MFVKLFVPLAISSCIRANNGNQSNEQSIRLWRYNPANPTTHGTTLDTDIGGTSAAFTAIRSDSPEIDQKESWVMLKMSA